MEPKGNAPSLSRREFIKAVVPGGWIGEARKNGISDLSTPAKVSLVKDAALMLGFGSVALLQQPSKEKRIPFSEKVNRISWEELKDPERLSAISNEFAEEYLKLTKSTRITKEDLIGEGKLNFYENSMSFIDGVREEAESFSPRETQWGFTHYESRRVFINMGSLIQQAQESGADAGSTLLNALWHEWGHLDITERTTGELIDNPTNPNARINTATGSQELFRSYRGAQVNSDTDFAFARFEEVLDESITLARMAEQVGLSSMFSAGDYYQNGVDFFPRFLSSAGIDLDSIYKMHAESDFEGLATLAGTNLPGDQDPMIKGMRLFNGISLSDPNLIQQTGVFDRIKN